VYLSSGNAGTSDWTLAAGSRSRVFEFSTVCVCGLPAGSERCWSPWIDAAYPQPPMYAAAGNQQRTIHFHDVRRRPLDHGPEMGAAENVDSRQFCTLLTLGLFSEDSGKEFFSPKNKLLLGTFLRQDN
jgi:hypothetical protein